MSYNIQLSKRNAMTVMSAVNTPLRISHHLTIPFAVFFNFLKRKKTSLQHRNTKKIEITIPKYLTNANERQKSL
jgi:hypothetical protein